MVVSEFRDRRFLLVIGGVSTYTNTVIRHNRRFKHREFEAPEIIFGIEITDFEEGENGEILQQST